MRRLILLSGGQWPGDSLISHRGYLRGIPFCTPLRTEGLGSYWIGKSWRKDKWQQSLVTLRTADLDGERGIPAYSLAHPHQSILGSSEHIIGRPCKSPSTLNFNVKL